MSSLLFLSARGPARGARGGAPARPGGGPAGSRVVLGCFSRALALSLDASARGGARAALLWQFAYPLDDPSDADAEARVDLANADGGTVELLENGHALVEFGKVARRGARARAAWGDGYATRVFEVVPELSTRTARAVAELAIPRSHVLDGQYRVAPRASIAGESAQAPFDVAR